MSEPDQNDQNSGIYEVENIDQYKDFISELKNGFPMVVEKILQYLTPRQLCLIPCVCKSWGEALVQSPVARKRRDHYLRKVRKLRKSVGQVSVESMSLTVCESALCLHLNNGLFFANNQQIY